MALKDWSTTAADNATIGSITFAEGQAPSTVNDSMRLAMAEIRADRDAIEWRDWGHTPVYSSAAVFTVSSSSDLSDVYVVGRRIRATDASTLYGTISASAYASSTQTVTVVLDTGSLSASLSDIALGFDPTGNPTKGFDGCFVYRTTTFSIPNNTPTAIEFAGEISDIFGAHSNSVNPSRVTIPAGVYIANVTASVNFDANATGRRDIFIYKGGSALTPSAQARVTNANASFGEVMNVATGDIKVVPGDYLEVYAIQSSGGALNVGGSSENTWMNVKFIR